MKIIRLMMVLLLAVLWDSVLAQDPPKEWLVLQGQVAPDFACQTLDGKDFRLSQQVGKVVVINFFATWCPPCKREMPHLEKHLYQVYKEREDFIIIALGRNHQAEELKPFKQDQKVNYPMAPDPESLIFNKYAESGIPRNVVIGKDGTIKLLSLGYTEERFQELLRAVQLELAQEVAQSDEPDPAN